MAAVNLAEAKAQLSALVERARQGEMISLTRHGKPVARLVPPEREWRPFDLEALKALTDSMPMQDQDGGDFVRAMRDSDRY